LWWIERHRVGALFPLLFLYIGEAQCVRHRSRHAGDDGVACDVFPSFIVVYLRNWLGAYQQILTETLNKWIPFMVRQAHHERNQ